MTPSRYWSRPPPGDETFGARFCPFRTARLVYPLPVKDTARRENRVATGAACLLALLALLATLPLQAQGGGSVTGAYLMVFHACNTAATNCMDPRNHSVYLAQSTDGAAWTRVAGWAPIPGSVPDVIRRGNVLYVYTARNEVTRYHLDTGVQEPPAAVSISGVPSGFVDPSLILDDQRRLALFFLYGRPGSDPAACPPGQPSCENRFGSATEVAGSDGTQFTLDAGDRAGVALSSTGALRSASDPDIFSDGRQFVLYISHGPSISVWTSPDLRGSYGRIGDLAISTGGIPSGHFDAASMRYWTYSHVNQGGVAVIRRAVHSDLSKILGEGDWTTVISGQAVGLAATTNVESPGFAVNTSGTDVSSSADLAVTKSASPNPVAVGGSLTYTIAVTNRGPDAAAGVVLTDDLPPASAFASARVTQGDCSRSGSTVTCAVGALASGATAVATLVVTPAAAGPISNTATVRGNQTDPEGGNNTATVTTSAAHVLHFAQWGNGAGVTSDAVFTNPSATSTAQVKMEFFDNSGLPLAVGFAGLGTRSSVDFSIAPLGAATLSTDGAGALGVGSARAVSNLRLGGVVRFSLPGIGIAGVGESLPLRGFVIPVRRKSGGINSGVAIRNTEDAVVAVTLTLRDTQGASLATVTRSLPPGGHLAEFLHELFPQVPTDDFQGTVGVQTDGGNVAATALELGPAAGQFTALPVAPLPQ